MKNNLSIYLIKETITDFSDIVETCRVLHTFNENTIAYYAASNSKTPNWLYDFFRIDNAHILNSNSRAILVKRLPISDNVTRIFAITFGYGKNLFKDEVYEEDFGIKIVLNTIEPNKIRKISKTDIKKNYKQSQEQMPRESDIGEFGFDFDGELIKFVSGKCDDEMFERSIISGGDYFSLSVEKDITNMDEFLLYCYQKYVSNDYKNKFDWVDNIKLVKQSNLINSLNNKAIEIINGRDFTNIWFAVPEVLKWDIVSGIYIPGQENRDHLYSDIKSETVLDSFKNQQISSFEQLKSKRIIVKSSLNDGSEIARWSASKCLVGSIEYENNVYAINGGNWYKINSDFAQEINNFYDRIPLSNLSFIDCPNGATEDTYNDLVIENDDSYLLLHKCNVNIEGTRGNSIETCDLVNQKNLIHVKQNGGSTYLSHLFNQAIVSCNSLKDPVFRNKLAVKLNEKNIPNFIDDPFDANDYTIVLGIINNHTNERPHIPFFSKVSIKYAYTQIINLGYKFELKNINKLS